MHACRSTLEDPTDTLPAAGAHIAACRFREAIRTAMAMAREANGYLEEKKPWMTVKQDREATATTLHAALTTIAALKQCFYPFLPFSSQKLHELLGREGTPEDEGWEMHPPMPGQALKEPSILFTKLDDSVIERETAKLGTPA